MVEKLLAMMFGAWIVRALERMGDSMHLFQMTPPGGGSGPLPTSSTVPQGARPASIPYGAIPVVSPSSAPFPESMPAGLPPFPSGWTFSATNDAIVQRAWSLLPVLKMGERKVEPSPTDPTKWLLYRKEPHAGGKTGVTVYTPRGNVAPGPSANVPLAQTGPVHVPGEGGVIPNWHPEPTMTSTAPASAIPPGATPMPVLKKGSQGEAVKKWQRIIGANPDGDFGPKTDLATRVWQKGHGLPDDGIVGPATWVAARSVAA